MFIAPGAEAVKPRGLEMTFNSRCLADLSRLCVPSVTSLTFVLGAGDARALNCQASQVCLETHRHM